MENSFFFYHGKLIQYDFPPWFSFKGTENLNRVDGYSMVTEDCPEKENIFPYNPLGKFHIYSKLPAKMGVMLVCLVQVLEPIQKIKWEWSLMIYRLKYLFMSYMPSACAVLFYIQCHETSKYFWTRINDLVFKPVTSPTIKMVWNSTLNERPTSLNRLWEFWCSWRAQAEPFNPVWCASYDIWQSSWQIWKHDPCTCRTTYFLGLW